MGGADDIIGRAFGKASEDEKRDNFEASSLKAVLRQLGWTAAEVRSQQEELGPNFGWDWFNGEPFVPDHTVFSTREFTFNFWELLEKPKASHPIVEAFFANRFTTPPFMIFGVFGHGRWVATQIPYDYTSHLHVVVNHDCMFEVFPFAQFFTRWKEDQ